MSIPTTMKFIVKGKSVDFRNREGSSPSIPNKKSILLPNYLYSFFFIFIHQWFKQNSISFSLILLFHKRIRTEIFGSYLNLVWVDMIPVQMNMYGQVIPIIESFTAHIIILTFTKKVFFLNEDLKLRNYRDYVKFVNTLVVSLIYIDTSTLLGWCAVKGRDSSVGRAED